MKSSNLYNVLGATLSLTCGLFLTAGLVFSQTQSDNPAPSDAPAAQNPAPDASGPANPYPENSTAENPAPSRGWPKANQPSGNQQTYNDPSANSSRDAEQNRNQRDDIPRQLAIRPGTFVNVRIDQELSSDKNRPGDSFTATLTQPIIVNGIVVAQRGQTIGGRIGEAQKAGRVEGVSRLGLQLTDLTLVDGQQLPIESQFISVNGGTSHGRDAGAIGGTTALGAAVGAAAGGGMGAGIGAAAGAAASTVGVLLTRGHATVIYPEASLTFRIQAPVVIATGSAPEAFRYAVSSDYNEPLRTTRATYSAPSYGCGPYGCPPPPPMYYNYGYYGPSYYPGIVFYRGPGLFYGPRYFYGAGFYRGYGGYRGSYGYRGGGYRGGGYHHGSRR
jgi:hypothetical protein